MPGQLTGKVVVSLLQSGKLWSVAVTSPTIFWFAFFVGQINSPVLTRKMTCEDSRVWLAWYLAYPAFFLVLPIMFASRIDDHIDRNLALRQKGVGLTVRCFSSVFCCYQAVLFSFFFSLPLLLRCCGLFTPWMYDEGFSFYILLFLFYTLLPLPLFLEGACLAVVRRFIARNKRDSEQPSGQDLTGTAQRWRFRDLLLTYTLGAMSFWLLSSLLAVSVSTLFGVAFENPLPTNGSLVMRSMVPLVWVLLVTGLVTHKLRIWQKPLRAIALGFTVVIIQLYPPLHFLDNFRTVCHW